MTLLVLLAVSSLLAEAQPRPCRPARQAMLLEIDKVQQAQHNVGLAVYVLHRGAVVLDLSLGYADLEDSSRVRASSRFGLASITKAFTGIALLKLVDEQRIDLDQPIQRYVPTFPVKSERPITLRMLAAHLGGIRHWGSERGPLLYARHFVDVDSILPLFANDTLAVPPATRYSYSSYGYNLLASAMQHAAGVPFQEIVGTRIIGPLALRSTGFDDTRVVMPGRVRRYTFYDLDTFAQLREPRRVPEWDYSHNMAGGNMVGTTRELARFARLVTRPGFLSSESYQVLTTPPVIDRATSSMAAGWFIRPRTDSLPLRLSISGSNAGLQAAISSYPEEDLVVVILSNSWGLGSSSGDLVVGLPERLARRCMAARSN
jgi:serine beta-lactamase-like protein LACTB, mitochondrial